MNKRIGANLLWVAVAILAGLGLYSWDSYEPPTSAEVAGTWRIDRALVNPAGSIPETFYSLAVALNPDATFTASNVPLGLFFDYPAAAEYTGTWALNHDLETRSSKLSLNFAAGADHYAGIYDAPAEFNQGQLTFRLGGQGFVYLTKTQ